MTPHACKGKAPVNVKEKYVLCNAIKHGYECVYVCAISKQSLVHSYLCVCVCVCNRSGSGSAMKEAPRDVYEIVHARSMVGMGMYVSVISPLLQMPTCVCLYVCVC